MKRGIFMEKMDANHDFSMNPSTRPPEPPSNPLAVVALVLAFTALPLSLIPILGPLVASGALILGIVANRKAQHRQGAGNGASVGAIAISVIALLASLLVSACTMAAIQGVNQGLKKQGVDLHELSGFIKKSTSFEMSGERIEALRGELKNEAEGISRLSDGTLQIEDIHRRIDNASSAELFLMQRFINNKNISIEKMNLDEREQFKILFKSNPSLKKADVEIDPGMKEIEMKK